MHLHSDSKKSNSNIVLVFPMDQVEAEPIGMLSEDKVVELSIPVKSDIFEESLLKNENDLEAIPQNGELKQPFNYHDEGSIGNTSDNLEGISEAASNHSADSSIELENEDQNDNLSDMVSANVSGRGTPNISGRDTPSSQVCENDDRPLAEAEVRQADSGRSQTNLSRQIRSEIDDKFCKFEIKKLLEGDETISLISETWSTDVLASDNETIDAGDSRHDRPHLQLVDQAIQEVPSVLDISETQSESAWSTDVMASDTERLTEVDNDDSVSVAQSDDTNSVARSDDTRSETDENACSSRRLSTSSNNSNINNISASNSQNYISCVTVNNPIVNHSFQSSTSQMPLNGVNYSASSTGIASSMSSSTKKITSSSSFQEYRKVDARNEKMNGKIYPTEQIDNNANTIYKSVILNNSEHSLTVSENSQVKTVFKSSSSVVTVSNRSSAPLIKESEINNAAGPSCFNTKVSEKHPN